ncbi:MAG: glycoside hydrolase family 92 protein, partial [Bacteroidales bacterium]|nr:glycoside hydrolase family 92 protein [Bacteroidales bacterium]
IEIDLGNRFGRGSKFVIEAENCSRKNMYIRKAVLNGTELESFYFPAAELLKGGSLVLEMGSEADTTLFR